jgi:allantoinase
LNDLTITHARIVSPSGIYEASIEVQEGIITTIAKTPRNTTDKKIDAANLLVFPGFLDAHVHFRESANPSEESFESGSRAAASGGITTVIDMPGSKPNAVLSLKNLEQKKELVSKRSIIDYALFGAAGGQNLSLIEEISRGGIVGYKTFMTSGPDYTAEDDATLLQVFEEIAKTGLVSAVHAEVAKLVELYSKRLKERGDNLPTAHPRSRPNICESLAIQKVIELSHLAGARAHVVHMSTLEGCDLIRSAKKRGYTITAETCPHYLLLTEEAMCKLGPYAKINPPLRTKRDQDALWKALRDGTIDFIASDHAPHTASNKDAGWNNIWEAGAGNPGTETMAMLILSKCKEGLFDYGRACALLAENPARVYGIYPKKGAIIVGADADFTIVDPKRKTKLDKNKMKSNSGFGTLYDGWETLVSPRFTIVRGKLVAEDWEITGKKGNGRFVSPAGMLRN